MKSQPHVLSREEFPRSSHSDPDWVMDNQMGLDPHQKARPTFVVVTRGKFDEFPIGWYIQTIAFSG